MRKKVWNPYVAGALTGLVLVLSVLFAGEFLGASTTFARGASAIENTVGIDAARFEYFTTGKGKYGSAALPDWQLMFVVGIGVGSLLSASLSGTFKIQGLPDMWRDRFGGSTVKRGLTAFFGGMVLLFGARLAGGCPSGHGLSGISQLAVSGFLSLAFFFAFGLITARILYGRQ